jgi:uncharacterized LabA/DUF88 family protein
MLHDIKLNNFAFIDGTNIYLSALRLGWEIDWGLFIEYLRKRHNVGKAYYFIGYYHKYKAIYDSLTSYGYTVIHKPVLVTPEGDVKGNCDAELVLHALIQMKNYNQALIVTGDGDIGCLVEYLRTVNKIKLVIACRKDSCSYLLRKAAGGNIMFLDYLRERFQKKQKGQLQD